MRACLLAIEAEGLPGNAALLARLATQEESDSLIRIYVWMNGVTRSAGMDTSLHRSSLRRGAVLRVLTWSPQLLGCLAPPILLVYTATDRHGGPDVSRIAATTSHLQLVACAYAARSAAAAAPSATSAAHAAAPAAAPSCGRNAACSADTGRSAGARPVAEESTPAALTAVRKGAAGEAAAARRIWALTWSNESGV
jgi:hypothetical protein